MNIVRTAIVALFAALMFAAPAMAAGYIPIGNPVYTEVPDTIIVNPDTITPQADTVDSFTTRNDPRSYDSNVNTSCPMITTMNGGKVYPSNVSDDCVPLSLAPSTGGTVVNTITANPDLITPNDPTIIHNAPTCSQFGWSPRGGFGHHSC